MRTVIGYGLLALSLTLPAAASATGWQPGEEVKAYAITGRTGMELYRSIGERGPQVGPGRVIAHTTFKLTWTRKYEQQGSACTLTSATGSPNSSVMRPTMALERGKNRFAPDIR